MNHSDPVSPPLGREEALEQEELRARTTLTVRLNKVVNRFADRDDLLLYCLWRAPHPGEAPAWFDPRAKEITLNARIGLQGADPKAVNPLTRAGRRKHPEIVGLLAHEAAHTHSTDMSEGAIEFRKRVHAEDPLLLEVFTLLEEPRIEFRQVQRRPHDRYYLRAQSVMIDLAPFTVEAEREGGEELDRWRSAMAALLVYGRVDAGILTSYDAEHVKPYLLNALGEDDFGALREVQGRALRLADGDLDGLLACSREWLGIVGRPGHEIALEALLELLAALFGCSGSGDGESGDSEGWANDAASEAASAECSGDAGGDGESQESGGEVLSGIGAALKSLSDEVATEVADEAEAQEAEEAAHAAGKEKARETIAEAKETARQEKVAASVFDPDRGDLPALKGTRAPTSGERRMAREVGRTLQRAQFRDRTTTKYASVTPPGRLNGRDAMLGAAQKAQGNPVTARPFHSKRSRYAPEPPITLGLLADFSGSMGWASEALASVAWVFSHAMAHVSGTMASALFAEQVVPLTRPGERPPQVQEYAANGGWENFGRAYDAINGALNLTRGKGVRLLLVLSDGHFVNAAARKAQSEALRDLKRAGVIVLWAGIPLLTDFPEEAIPVQLTLPSNAVGGDEGGPAGNRTSFERLTESIIHELVAALKALR